MPASTVSFSAIRQLLARLRRDPSDVSLRTALDRQLRQRSPRSAPRFGEDADLLVVRGVAALTAGDALGARALLSEAEQQDPLHPVAARYLSEACHGLGRRIEALAALGRAAERAPGDASLQRAHRRLAARQTPAAQKEAARRNRLLDASPGWWLNGALAADQRGDRDAALAALELALARDPGHPTALHLRDAWQGRTSARPPAGYVARLFDDYADSFEEHLVGDLGYRLPQAMAARAARSTGAALDLGCGTGLLAPLVREKVRGPLVGVDLSPKMLARCRARGLYDALHLADAAEWLRAGPPGVFAQMFAADVLIYVGDARPLLAAAAHGLAAGGSLLLSVEALEEEAGEGFRLMPSGRYAHTDLHIRQGAAGAGLTVTEADAVRIRRQGRGWERGVLYRLERLC